jgi:hypothetical protein
MALFCVQDCTGRVFPHLPLPVLPVRPNPRKLAGLPSPPEKRGASLLVCSVLLCSPIGRRAIQSAVEVDHKLRLRSANNNRFNIKFKKTYVTNRKVAGSRPDEVKDFLSSYLILPAALGPGVYSASNRNEYQKHKYNVSGE